MPLARLDLAGLLHAGGAQYLAGRRLSTPESKAWRAICACRSPALGGQRLACAACGHTHWQFHSCRNRHCPRCGARAKDAWLQGRLADLLPVPYCHLVFTLPHALNSLYLRDRPWLIQTLFASVAATLTAFAGQPRWMGCADGQPAFSLVLHTWSQDLSLHLHVHAVMACGVLHRDGHWHTPARQPDFLFPVQALSRVFRGKFMAALVQRAATEAASAPPTPTTPTAPVEPDINLSPTGRKALYRHPWVVYAKTALGGPAQALAYLSRYTHRTAISNERILGLSQPDDHVVLSVRARSAKGPQRRTGQHDAHDEDGPGPRCRLRLPLQDFIGRFLQHVLPKGVQRIRHYGVLANGCKKTQLAQARVALGQPAPQPQAVQDAQAFMARVARVDILSCRYCQGPLRVVQTLAGLRRLPEPGVPPPAPACAPAHTCHPPGTGPPAGAAPTQGAPT